MNFVIGRGIAEDSFDSLFIFGCGCEPEINETNKKDHYRLEVDATSSRYDALQPMRDMKLQKRICMTYKSFGTPVGVISSLSYRGFCFACSDLP